MNEGEEIEEEGTPREEMGEDEGRRSGGIKEETSEETSIK